MRWRCGSCATASSTGCGSTIRTGSPTRPATCGGCGTRASSTCGWRRSSTPASTLRDWPVDGTVGYEFLNDVAALYVDPAGEAPLTDLWVEVSGDDRRFGELAFEAKLEQARTTFAPEVERLLRDAPARVTGLERALASLPVYRTYVEPWSGRVEDADREAVAEAGLQRSLSEILLLERPGWDAFVTRFQQTTPPVMAKGVEDTAFYRYARLLALNDVGGDPGRFSSACRRSSMRPTCERAERFPRNLLVTQTHDTKRSGDVRARIGALASMPEAFARHVRDWLSVCRSLTSGGAPDPVEQLFIFQTLLGAWPIRSERLEAYLEKALREAKVHTTWVEPNEAHEAAVKRFARALYTHRDFLRTFEPFQREVAEAGDRMALGQLLLKLTVPGVPDIYQGDELLNLSLGRPRQPPPGRLGGAPRGAGRPAAEAARDPAHARAAVGEAFAGPTSRSTPARTRSRSCAAATCSSRPGCAATPRSSSPPGDWDDVLELDYAQFGIALSSTAVPLQAALIAPDPPQSAAADRVEAVRPQRSCRRWRRSRRCRARSRGSGRRAGRPSTPSLLVAAR